jgi:hypothetical protein
VRNNTGNQRHTHFFEDTPARLLTKLDKAPKNSASFFDHAQLKTRMSRLLLSQIKKETNKEVNNLILSTTTMHDHSFDLLFMGPWLLMSKIILKIYTSNSYVTKVYVRI